MRTSSHLVVNTAAQFLGRLVSSAVIFLSTLLLARVLGGEYYGEFTKASAYLAIFYVVVDLGFNPVFLHQAHLRLADLWGAFLAFRLIIGSILAVAAVLAMWVLTRTVSGFTALTYAAVVVGAVSIIGYGLFLTTSAIFQTHRRYDLVAVSLGAGSLVTLLIVVLFYQVLLAAPARGVLVAITATVAGVWVTALGSFYFSRSFVKTPALRYDPLFIKRLVNSGLPLGVTMVASSIYFRSSILILAAHRSSFDVGAFGLAFKFFEFGIAPATFFMNSLYPDLLKKETASLVKNFTPFLISIVTAAAVVGTGGWILAPLLTLVRSDFSASVPTLRLLALVTPLFFLTAPLTPLAVILKKQRQLMYAYVFATMFNVGFGLLLIPRYGSVAAVTVLGLTEMLVAVSGWYIVRTRQL